MFRYLRNLRMKNNILNWKKHNPHKLINNPHKFYQLKESKKRNPPRGRACLFCPQPSKVWIDLKIWQTVDSSKISFYRKCRCLRTNWQERSLLKIVNFCKRWIKNLVLRQVWMWVLLKCRKEIRQPRLRSKMNQNH